MSGNPRLRIIMERVEVAAEQVTSAADNEHQLRAVLVYWFGVMYDEGLQQAKHIVSETASLKDTIDGLRDLNRRLQAEYPDQVVELPPTRPTPIRRLRRPKPRS